VFKHWISVAVRSAAPRLVNSDLRRNFKATFSPLSWLMPIRTSPKPPRPSTCDDIRRGERVGVGEKESGKEKKGGCGAVSAVAV